MNVNETRRAVLANERRTLLGLPNGDATADAIARARVLEREYQSRNAQAKAECEKHETAIGLLR